MSTKTIATTTTAKATTPKGYAEVKLTKSDVVALLAKVESTKATLLKLGLAPASTTDAKGNVSVRFILHIVGTWGWLNNADFNAKANQLALAVNPKNVKTYDGGDFGLKAATCNATHTRRRVSLNAKWASVFACVCTGLTIEKPTAAVPHKLARLNPTQMANAAKVLGETGPKVSAATEPKAKAPAAPKAKVSKLSATAQAKADRLAELTKSVGPDAAAKAMQDAAADMGVSD